jgi:alpha-ketoglutarate-dependent taurine dioxygenase
MGEPLPTATLERKPGCWHGQQLREHDWRLAMPEAAVAEIESRLDSDAPLSAGGTFAHTRAFLARVRARLFEGPGVVVAGRLPVAQWGDTRAQRAVSILAHLMGPPVQQTHGGETLYAVQDRGLEPGPGVRRSLTNVAQAFHTDGPWVASPPWIVGLYCLRAAGVGGSSQCISMRALFDDLAIQAPALARRLEQAFIWHRQAEHAPQDALVSRHPMVWRDPSGRWCARLYADYVTSGYAAAGEPIDAMASQALERIGQLSAEPHRRLSFDLAAGEVLWLNNRWCAHARSAFEPSCSTTRPRLLVRVWHRLDGAVALDG